MKTFKAEIFSEETQYTSVTCEAETVQDCIDELVAEGYQVLCVTDSEGNQYS